MFNSRKFTIGMVGVAAILLIVVGAALLNKYLSIDVMTTIQWAIPTIGALCGLTQGSIAWEDTRKAQAAGVKAPPTE